MPAKPRVDPVACAPRFCRPRAGRPGDPAGRCRPAPGARTRARRRAAWPAGWPAPPAGRRPGRALRRRRGALEQRAVAIDRLPQGGVDLVVEGEHDHRQADHQVKRQAGDPHHVVGVQPETLEVAPAPQGQEVLDQRGQQHHQPGHQRQHIQHAHHAHGVNAPVMMAPPDAAGLVEQIDKLRHGGGRALHGNQIAAGVQGGARATPPP